MFEASDLLVEPYYKKPRMLREPMIALADRRMGEIPSSSSMASKLDFIWIASLGLRVTNTPMWVGWNARMVKTDNLPMQQIEYLPQINQSPTSTAVVVHTLKMGLQLADECGQRYISQTYDLAIAKMALAIQAEEKPGFDRIFIQLGSFHIELAFFKAVGKFFEESGGPYILAESGVLAQGSLHGFLAGKHYNRCKRLHSLFAAALEILLFEAFLKKMDDEDMVEEVSHVLSTISESGEFSSMETYPAVLMEMFEKYQAYYEEMEEGKYGATAQFWTIYINLIRLYRKFVRAVRSGDHLLYISTLPDLMSLFFAFNHPNYARWLSRFHDNFLRMEETHPGISEDFENGILSVRRTAKPFSRSAIDLTLEQTINADAASSSTGKRIGLYCSYEDHTNDKI